MRKRQGIKNYLWVFVFIFFFMFILFRFISPSKMVAPRSYQPIQQKTKPTTMPTVQRKEKNVFVPYWATTVPQNGYETMYYFGLGFDNKGETVSDLSLQKMTMMSDVPAQKKMLVIRLLHDSVIDSLLSSYEVQANIVKNTLEQLETHSFRGAVLDLEKSYSLNKDTSTQITKFVQYFCSALKKNYKDCFVLIYGDTMYRGRPYNVQEISNASDRIIIMAYDFHKAGGEPGPNFPLARRSKSTMSEGGPETIDYGYDFKQMISDFTAVVPKEKLEVAFGMFGYDWTLNDQGTPLKSAQAYSVQSLKSKVESLKNDKRYTLRVTRNASQEPRIDYIDEEGRRHVVWYEDEESEQVKIDYLLERGIGLVSYWAWEYFDGV